MWWLYIKKRVLWKGGPSILVSDLIQTPGLRGFLTWNRNCNRIFKGRCNTCICRSAIEPPGIFFPFGQQFFHKFFRYPGFIPITQESKRWMVSVFTQYMSGFFLYKYLLIIILKISTDGTLRLQVYSFQVTCNKSCFRFC